MGSKYQMSRFVVVSLCLLIVGCAGTKKTGRPGGTDVNAGFGGAEGSIEGTVVNVPGQPEQLTSGLADNGIANYHPDGNRIIFQSNRNGKWQIYELNLTDMSETRLRESDFIEENPVWSSEGSNILFVASREGDDEWNREIMKFNPDSGELISMTNSPGDDWYPVAMNEEFFVFLSERDANNNLPVHAQANSLYLAYMNGGPPTFLSGSADDFRAPAVVDDEKLLVLNRSDRIAIYDLTTRNSLVVSPKDIVCSSFGFSQSERWIVFTGSTQDSERLYILDTQKNVYQEISTGYSNIRNPGFSPDSKWLLFGAEVNGFFQLFRLKINSL